MARSTPQSFQKRQRERRNREKAASKLEQRLIRSEVKRRAKAEGNWPLPEGHTSNDDDYYYYYEDDDKASK